MKTLFSAALIAAVLISGCSSLSNGARASFAGASSNASASQFPQETDQGKF